MPFFHINEFIIDSTVPLATDFSDAPPVNDSGGSTVGRISLKRASLANIPCIMRKVRRQPAYDVGSGLLIEPHPSIAFYIDLNGKSMILDCPDSLILVGIAWIIHVGLGAATIAHGGLPLHGSGLEFGNRFVGLMADSGSGKSTLSWYLLQNGFKFANDDLIPTQLRDDKVVAFPSVSLHPKLRRDTVDKHGLKLPDLLKADYGTGEEEYHVPLAPEQRVTAPNQLHKLFVLRPLTDNACSGNCQNCKCAAGEGKTPYCYGELAPDEVIPLKLDQKSAASTLFRDLHAAWLIGKWLDIGRLQRMCEKVATHVPVVELYYRRSYEILPHLAETIKTITALG